MDQPRPDELAELRRRAYGRAPDIDRDPEALARLRALEAGERPDEERPAGQEPAASPPEESGVPEADSAPPPAPRRRIALLWTASILASALLAAGATAGVTAWVADRSGPPGREVATLTLTNSGDVPGWVNSGLADSLVSEDFHGLRVLKQPSGEDGGSCIYVLQSATSDGDAYGGLAYSGVSYSGCTAGPFPAVAQLIVTAAQPDELRDAFSEGSALRFVLEGETVHVSTG
ncbi:hypothetical protein GRS96_00100 [Rathayibacter sp. VKM Ac-2803]|uniref:hypothetical protein n=1 Tax=unclassified Rathayibacter TaxID=2609250 RepID=UPI001359B1EF|nr:MULTISPECIES: hypothetical protein [unclassified Rathayibacter]MWV47671.1 hypothetical protein [Rathayibacter sp. VKM Ac-2803]MWV57829.1 hypothetical protein [Rathayibacter sp. VKM Ac-2754]